MKRFILLIAFVVLLLPSVSKASPQSDVVQQFERLQAMLDIGSSRMDVQKLLVDTKMLVNKLPAGSDFTKKADHLIESIKMNYVITDLAPTKKSVTLLNKETLDELLPGLKASLSKPNKKSRP